jgi:hypothetical protein
MMIPDDFVSYRWAVAADAGGTGIGGVHRPESGALSRAMMILDDFVSWR